MARKIFENQLPNEDDELVIFDPEDEEIPEFCLGCGSNNFFFSKKEEYEVTVICAGCDLCKRLPSNYKWEKFLKKEGKS